MVIFPMCPLESYYCRFLCEARVNAKASRYDDGVIVVGRGSSTAGLEKMWVCMKPYVVSWSEVRANIFAGFAKCHKWLFGPKGTAGHCSDTKACK